MTQLDPCDRITADLLERFALEIIVRISLKTKLHPTDLASLVPGLLHSHWYKQDDVDGCAYCRRISGLVSPR